MSERSWKSIPAASITSMRWPVRSSSLSSSGVPSPWLPSIGRHIAIIHAGMPAGGHRAHRRDLLGQREGFLDRDPPQRPACLAFHHSLPFRAVIAA
ncbi:MAG: hypothetical protein WDN24_04730 [Sphingomonas sp.]